MNIDPDYSKAVVPRLHDFMVDPFSISGVGAYQYNGACLAAHLVANPSVDRLVPTFGHGFPVVVCGWFVAFDGANVSDRRRPPAVWLVVKAEIDLSCHLLSTLPRSLIDPTRDVLATAIGHPVIDGDR